MEKIKPEITYKTSRSGGKGGQNVNKVETAVEALWNVNDSELISDEERALIVQKLSNRINKDGALVVKATDTRSQLENKDIATQKLIELVRQSLVKPKKRKPTKIPKAIVEKRLESKRYNSLKKQNRKKDW